MALLTVSTESSLMKSEARNAVFYYGKYISQVSSKFWLLPVRAYKGFCRHSTLTCKRGIVSVSTEFGGKQSHEIGPRYLIKSLVLTLCHKSINQISRVMSVNTALASRTTWSEFRLVLMCKHWTKASTLLMQGLGLKYPPETLQITNVMCSCKIGGQNIDPSEGTVWTRRHL